jgi:hypothetical protein
LTTGALQAATARPHVFVIPPTLAPPLARTPPVAPDPPPVVVPPPPVVVPPLFELPPLDVRPPLVAVPPSSVDPAVAVIPPAWLDVPPLGGVPPELVAPPDDVPALPSGWLAPSLLQASARVAEIVNGKIADSRRIRTSGTELEKDRGSGPAPQGGDPIDSIQLLGPPSTGQGDSVDGSGESGYAGKALKSFLRAALLKIPFRIALLSASFTAWTAPAGAADGEWHAGGRAGIAAMSGTGVEPALGVNGAYELSDMFDAKLELLGTHHVGGDGTDVLSAAAGLAYKIDVFEWIPYVSALAGYYGYGGKPGPHGEHGSRFGAALQLGLDYLPARNFALGAEVRLHSSFDDGFHFPFFTTVTLGAEYRWGW